MGTGSCVTLSMAGSNFSATSIVHEGTCSAMSCEVQSMRAPYWT